MQLSERSNRNTALQAAQQLCKHLGAGLQREQRTGSGQLQMCFSDTTAPIHRPRQQPTTLCPTYQVSSSHYRRLQLQVSFVYTPGSHRLLLLRGVCLAACSPTLSTPYSLVLLYPLCWVIYASEGSGWLRERVPLFITIMCSCGKVFSELTVIIDEPMF